MERGEGEFFLLKGEEAFAMQWQDDPKEHYLGKGKSGKATPQARNQIFVSMDDSIDARNGNNRPQESR